MTRLEKFRSLSTHAWYGKAWLKLSLADRNYIENWITTHDYLSTGDFEMAANRMFLDLENKPKNWVRIQEFVATSNVTLPPRSNVHG